MAVSPMLIKVAAALLTSEKGRKGVGFLLVAIFAPVILIAAILCSATSGGADSPLNDVWKITSLLNCCMKTAAAVWKKIWRGKKCFVFFTKRFNRFPQRNRNSSVNCSSCIVQHENLRRNMVFHSQPLSSASSVCYRL